MIKRPVFWIVLVVATALVVVAAVWGKQYYENRYVGSDYYTMVPLDFDITPEVLYSMSGEAADIGKAYSLTAYNKQGEAKTVEFSVSGEDSEKYPQPGTYLRVKASSQIVLGLSIIEESAVPEKALARIRESMPFHSSLFTFLSIAIPKQT